MTRHATIVTAIAALLLGAGVAAPPGDDGVRAAKPRRAQVTAPVKLGRRLAQYGASGEIVRVLIALGEQPQGRIMRQRAAWAHPRAMGAEWEAAEARRAAFEEIEAAIEPSQNALENELWRLGARRVKRLRAVNLLVAELPAASVGALAAHPLVAAVDADRSFEARLDKSTSALGAPSFWNMGLAGAGQRVAVADSGVRTDHPAFAGLEIVSRTFLDSGRLARCFGDDASSAEDQSGHGSHVAGIVASRGSGECVDCRGVAPQLGTLFNLKVAYREKASSGCDSGSATATSADVFDALDWLVQNTAARIVNFSYGSKEGDLDGNDLFSKTFDQLADQYGVLFTVAAGNSGPKPGTVASPGVAYNTLTVANWTARGSVAATSSRGPTADGRQKPDITAPGTSIRSLAYNWDSPGVADYTTKTGTSMAAPHMAGAAALLAEANVSEPRAIKAILLNQASSGGGWVADSGWGYADLEKAAAASNDFRSGTLGGQAAANHYRLYRIRSGQPVRATVVWNRHITSTYASALNDIDLYAYDAAGNGELARSTGAGNNVEQIATASGGDVVARVAMYTDSLGGGIAAEPFAIAFSSAGVTELAGPLLSVSCSGPAGAVPPGASFGLSCRVANGGDTPAFGVTGNVALPAGFGGTAAFSFARIDPGTAQTANLTITGAQVKGTYTLQAAVSSATYGEMFTAAATSVIMIEPQPGAPVAPIPAAGAAGVAVTAGLSWRAGTGAASYDVYFGPVTPPPFRANTAATSYAPGLLAPGTTYYWRVVSRNAGGTASSPEWSFRTAPPVYAVTGTIRKAGAPLAGVAVVLSGGAGGRQTTDAAGRYTFTGLVAGASFTVTPALGNHRFEPASLTYQEVGANQTADFVASYASPWSGPLMAYRTGSDEVTLDGYPAGSARNAGGVFAGDPAVDVAASGRAYVVSRDSPGAAVGALYLRWFLPGSGYASWQVAGGEARGNPALAVAGESAWVAARDRWNAYWVREYDAVMGFGSWQFLGGIFSTDPVLAACADGTMFTAGRDTWGGLWVARRDTVSRAWQPWVFAGGLTQGKPALGCGADGAAWLAARDPWNGLWLTRIDRTGAVQWNAGGGIVHSDLDIVVVEDQVHVFGLSYGTPYQRSWRIGAGWEAWVKIGGTLADFSAAVHNGVLYVAGRTGPGEVFWWNKAGSVWTSSGAPGVAAGAHIAAGPRRAY